MSLYLDSLSRTRLWENVKCFAEGQVNNIHSFNMDRKHFVVGGDQVGLALYALGKSVLSFPNHLLHLACKFLEELFPGAQVRLMGL